MAESEKSKKEAASASKEKGDDKEKKGLPSVIILAVMVIVAAGGGFGVSMLISSGPDEALGDAVKSDIFPPVKDGDEFEFYTFDSMTVSLVSPRGKNYLRSTLVLQIKKDYFEKVTARIDKKKHEIIDLFIS